MTTYLKIRNDLICVLYSRTKNNVICLAGLLPFRNGGKNHELNLFTFLQGYRS